MPLATLPPAQGPCLLEAPKRKGNHSFGKGGDAHRSWGGQICTTADWCKREVGAAKKLQWRKHFPRATPALGRLAPKHSDPIATHRHSGSHLPSQARPCSAPADPSPARDLPLIDVADRNAGTDGDEDRYHDQSQHVACREEAAMSITPELGGAFKQPP